MKKIFKIWTLAIISVSIFMACQNDDELVITTPINELSASADSMGNAAGKTTSTLSSTTSSSAITKISFNESDVEPRFGKPNVTKYSFKVYELSGKFNISVKLYEKATGDITYMPMTRVGNYWVLSTKIKINGWYDWRYVYSINKSNISDNAYKLCNTNNSFNPTDISSLTWPFGSDGSTWEKRFVLVEGLNIHWAGGEEGWTGYGWNEGSHTGYREQYSDDWNRGIGTMDLGAEIYSPLDGVIEESNGSYSTDYGRSKFVSVIQEGKDGRIYRFYVAHLDEIGDDIYKGRYVRAGVTKIATIGQSGASSPHAHCNLRDVTNGDDKSIKFHFDAVK